MNQPRDVDDGEPTGDDLRARGATPLEAYIDDDENAPNGGTAFPPEADPEQAPDPADELVRAAAAAGGPPASLGAPPLRRPGGGGLFAGLAVVAAIVVLGAVYGPPFMRRVGELRTQRTCAEYLAPRTLVAYEEHPDKAATLLANGGSYVAVPLPAGGDSSPAGGPPVAGHVPPAWREMRRWAFPKSPEAPGALLFVHERQTAAGVRGVVAVEADRAARRLRVSFIYPGTYTSGPTAVANVAVKPPPKEGEIVLSAGRDPFQSKLPNDPDPAARADLRFFAGRADAEDWTHFVIPYERGAERGELEMWVIDESTFHYVDRRFAK